MVLSILVALALAGASQAPGELPPGTVTTAYIQRLDPKISDERAFRLGVTIRKWADHYAVDPLLVAAIIKQESDFRSGLKSCVIVHRNLRCEVTCDYGIGQVNALWIAKWNLDPDRLQNDDEYNIRTAARILALLKREFAHEEPEQWYGRYHSGTPSKKTWYLGQLEALLAMR